MIPFSSAREMKIVNNLNKYKEDEKKIQRKKNTKKIKIILILIVVFLIICIILSVVAFLYIKNNNNKEISNQNNSKQDIDDSSKMIKCNITNCKECKESKDNNICISCLINTFPFYGENNEIIACIKENKAQGKCEIGKDEKCLSCDYSKGECKTCNNGYFIPDDETIRIKCQKCSINNCKICSGNKLSDICTLCEDFTNPIYENGKIQNCLYKIEEERQNCLTFNTQDNECESCNLGYKLEKGKCILNHHFKAIIKSEENYEKIKLSEQLLLYTQEMIIDGQILNSPVKEYTFPEKGEHILYYKIEMPNSVALNSLFEDMTKMTSISFTKLFDTKNYQIMDRMFYNCQQLTKIDFTNFNTNNVMSMNYMFYQCLSLTSIDLSNLNTSLVADASYMFANCLSLQNIDLSNFKSSKIELLDNMFQGCNSLISIDLSNLSTENTIISVDNMFEDCISLEKINFNNFNTNKVEKMSYLFKGCSSLASIDLSTFNTEEVNDVTEMFSGCSSLTSIDISNFYLPKVHSLNAMFIDCINLKYINMELLTNQLMKTFDNLPSSGTIIANNSIKNDISNALEGWNIIAK